MSELNRKPNESFVEYIERLINYKDSKTYDIDNSEIYELITGENVGSDHARKTLGFIKKILPRIIEDGTKNITEDAIIQRIQIERQALEKEKVKVRTEKISLSQMLREEARYELFIEHAIDAIKKYGQISVRPQTVYKQDIKRSGILFFADCHYGKVLKIPGLDGEILNEYSPEIFEDRMWKMLNQILHICNKEGFNAISVFNLGDDLEGMLRIGQLMSLKYGLIESAIRYAYFLSSWLDELSKYIYVDFFSTEGNHTDVRLLNAKKGTFPHENMGKIILTLISEILKDNQNIAIHKNHTVNIFTNIQGFNILGTHGEESNVAQALKDYSHTYNKKIDCIATGHKHHANSINSGIGKFCIGVGSIIGVDEYSIDLKKTSNPTASFVVFENELGKIEEKTIFLN